MPAAPEAIARHVNLPVYDGGRLVAVAGVANKEEEYHDSDVRQLALLMQGMWRLVQRRRTQRELDRHREHLEQLVEERTGELARANESLRAEIEERAEIQRQLNRTVAELERSNTELEQFAYVASHDLQEPLRMVASYVQLLERRYADKLDDDAREFVAFAVDGATRMKRLINDMLTFSRVGTRARPFKPTDLNAVVDMVLANLKPTIEEQGATVNCEALPTVECDEMQLVQLLQNLVANGIKFRGDDPPEVNIGVEVGDDEWVLTVRDNGIGIEPQYYKRIFVIFQRLHGKKEYTGTGIGLAVCKKIVERHGGRIWVESEPGKGAAFKFTLPMSRSS
jgi:light-regulated signal transduction histidine kinase (bacteriophytochrome)